MYRYCYRSGWEGRFSTIEKALEACNKSNVCLAVHDYKCDGKEPFKMCNGLENISPTESTKGTCVYKKVEGTISIDIMRQIFFLYFNIDKYTMV